MGLAARACELYPCEGWENWRIESLLVLGNRGEAERVYRETAAHAQELGDSSPEWQERFRETGEQLRHPEGTAEEIGRCLMESRTEEGAYGCTLLGFSDCFRMLKRVTSRRGPVCFSLLLCTILDAGGRPVQDPKTCEKQGERLCQSFKSTSARETSIQNTAKISICCCVPGRRARIFRRSGSAWTWISGSAAAAAAAFAAACWTRDDGGAPAPLRAGSGSVRLLQKFFCGVKPQNERGRERVGLLYWLQQKD